jgi:hypothetical protein
MNRVFVNDYDIVEIVVDGDQTIEFIHSMARDAKVLLAKQRAANKSAMLLDNLMDIGSVSREARKLVVDYVRELDYDKLAMVGKGGVFQFSANLLLQAIGKGRIVKYFDDYGAAVKWLKS